MEFTDFPGFESFLGDFRLPDIENRAKTAQPIENTIKMPEICPKYALRFGSYTPKIWRLSAQSFFGDFSAVERIFTEILVSCQRIGPQKPSKTVENCSFFA